VVLVSGTNGKTTTSHMLAAALSTLGEVAHNASGSNMADGAVAALSDRPDARWAVLEVDELHLASWPAAATRPPSCCSNLTRDQTGPGRRGAQDGGGDRGGADHAARDDGVRQR